MLRFALGSISAIAQTNPGSQRLSSLVGTWTCSYKGPYGNRTLTATGTRLDEDWVQLKGGTGGDTLVTYDAKRRLWLQFRTGLQGNYALLIARAPATARTLHWKMVFPQRVPVGTTTISLPSASERVVTSVSTNNGKPITSSAFCTKR